MTKRPQSTQKKLMAFAVRHAAYKQKKSDSCSPKVRDESSVLHAGQPVAHFVTSGKCCLSLGQKFTHTQLSELADHEEPQLALAFYGMGPRECKDHLWIHRLCNKEGSPTPCSAVFLSKLFPVILAADMLTDQSLDTQMAPRPRWDEPRRCPIFTHSGHPLPCPP